MVTKLHTSHTSHRLHTPFRRLVDGKPPGGSGPGRPTLRASPDTQGRRGLMPDAPQAPLPRALGHGPDLRDTDVADRTSRDEARTRRVVLDPSHRAHLVGRAL